MTCGELLMQQLPVDNWDSPDLVRMSNIQRHLKLSNDGFVVKNSCVNSL